MSYQTLLGGIYGLLIEAAPLMAFGCFLAAALSWRSGGGMSFEMGGPFTQKIIWGFVFLGINSLPLILATAGVNIGGSMPTSGAGLPWIAPLITGMRTFVGTYLIGYVVPVAAAALVVKGLLDSAAGENPVPSLISSLLVLSVYPLFTLSQGFVNSNGAEFSIPCGMMRLVGWAGNTVCPIVGSMCVVAAIVNFVRNKPWGQMAITAITMVCFSGIWQLFKSWEGVTTACSF